MFYLAAAYRKVCLLRSPVMKRAIIPFTIIPRPVLRSARLRLLRYGRKLNLLMTRDGRNFPGLWLDPETNISTETIFVDQTLLDSSRRVIEKHKLIYTTYSIPRRFQVFSNINVTEVAISPGHTSCSYITLIIGKNQYICN